MITASNVLNFLPADPSRPAPAPPPVTFEASFFRCVSDSAPNYN